MAGAALVLWFVAGWIRGHLIDGLTEPILAIPWIWVRRVILGSLIDLPTALLTIATFAGAARIIVLRSWPAPTALIGAILLLDAVSSALVVDSMRLWTDPVVVGPRLLVCAVAVVVSSRLVSRQQKGTRQSQKEKNDAVSESDEVDEAETSIDV